jgi:hypothetical protein
MARQSHNFKGSCYRRARNTVVLEVHESPCLDGQDCAPSKDSTLQASLTCCASWTISGLLMSIRGIDIVVIVYRSVWEQAVAVCDLGVIIRYQSPGPGGAAVSNIYVNITSRYCFRHFQLQQSFAAQSSSDRIHFS